MKQHIEEAVKYIKERDLELLKILEQNIYKSVSQDLHSKSTLGNTEIERIIGKKGETTRISQIASFSKAASWHAHDLCVGYLISEHMRRWREQYFLKLGLFPLSNNFLYRLGVYEQLISINLYPKYQEIDAEAKDLRGMFLASYNKLKGLEVSYVFMPIFKMKANLFNKKNLFELFPGLLRRVKDLQFFVEMFYSKIAYSAQIYDQRSNGLVANFCCCFYKAGKFEKQVYKLRDIHMKRCDVEELSFVISNLKQELSSETRETLVSQYGTHPLMWRNLTNNNDDNDRLALLSDKRV